MVEAGRLLVHQDQLWKYFPSLVAHFRKQGLSLEEAEDVVQDAMVAAVENLSSFREEALLSTWLFGIAKKQCLMFWRRQRAQKRDGVQVPLLEEGEDAEFGKMLADSAVDAEHRALAMERYRAVRKEIPKLPRRMKTALILFAVRGLPYKDIAAQLQCEVNDVSYLIHQARQKLRRVVAVR